jgi:hypothetical protein
MGKKSWNKNNKGMVRLSSKFSNSEFGSNFFILIYQFDAFLIMYTNLFIFIIKLIIYLKLICFGRRIFSEKVVSNFYHYYPS